MYFILVGLIGSEHFSIAVNKWNTWQVKRLQAHFFSVSQRLSSKYLLMMCWLIHSPAVSKAPFPWISYNVMKIFILVSKLSLLIWTCRILRCGYNLTNAYSVIICMEKKSWIHSILLFFPPLSLLQLLKWNLLRECQQFYKSLKWFIPNCSFSAHYLK